MNAIPRQEGYFMQRKPLKINCWRQLLSIFAIFLTILMTNCRSSQQTAPILKTENLTVDATLEATSSYYDSNTPPEDCFFCGNSEGTSLSLYRGQKNLDIINLNTFALSPITINLYDDSGRQIEEAVSKSSTHIMTTKQNGILLSVFPNVNRGYASAYLSFKSTERLNKKQATNHLCSDCLNHIMKNCLDKNPMAIGVIDFRTNEVRLFEKRVLGFLLGDYYISCNNWNSTDNGRQEMDLFIFYCPERYQSEKPLTYHLTEKRK